MAGYVIHISVAEEYLRKHNNQFEHEKFIEGVIAPDDVKDKSLTHYGPRSTKPDLCKFINTHPMESDYDHGYFLHLFTDFLFYNHYIDTFSKKIYHDYDLLNGSLLERYDIVLPEKIKDQVFFQEDGELTILNYELVCKMIDEISALDINQIVIEIKEGNKYWSEFRELIEK